MDLENINLSQSPSNIDLSASNLVPQKKSKIVLYLCCLVIIVVLLLIGLFVFIQQRQNQNTTATPTPTGQNTVPESGKIKTETAVHTFYEKGQVTATVNEVNRRYGEQMLETVVTKDGQKLSQQLFLPNMILQMNNGALSQQKFISSSSKTVYRTTSENILEYIKSNSDLKPTISNTNGVEMERYTLGENKVSSFFFIKTALAQDNTNLVNIYVGKSTKEVKKIERIDPLTNQNLEVIDYQIELLPPPPPPYELIISQPPQQVTEVPNTLTSPPITPNNQLDPLKEKLLTDLQQEEMIKQSLALLPIIAVANEMNQEATSIKVNNIQPPMVPDEAIYLEPISVIPTTTSYNSPIMMLTSKVFNQRAVVDKDIREKGGFDTLTFVKNNIKIRIDGVEIQNSNTSLSDRQNNPTSLTVPWTVISMIPKGLTPGYHTVEVYMVNSWYLAPSLLVVLPKPNERVTELQLTFDKPPKAVLMPDNQNYKITLYGKNFSKPLSVYLDDTLLSDSNVVVSNPEELMLIIPLSIPKPSHGPAYDVTIVKDGQRIIKPSFLSIGGPQ